MEEPTPTLTGSPGGPRTDGFPPDGFAGGRFKVRALLGRGAEGAVYEAVDTLLHRRVALKVYRATDGRGTSRFLAGARLGAQLCHPNIVGTYDFFVEHEYCVIVQELLEGSDLDRAVLTEPRDQVRALSAVCVAMSHSHERGIVHCDLKLNNVHYGRAGLVKVLDFGLARDLSPASAVTAPIDEHALAGTMLYLAPERLNAQPPSPANDVWSFGVLAFRLASGRFPFCADTLLGLARAICQDQIPSLLASGGLTAEWSTESAMARERLAEVVSSCLQRSAGDRPSFGTIGSSLLELLGLLAKEGPSQAA